jgi:soluble P-type ATPase
LTPIERKDRKGYWSNELESLGIELKRMNDLNDRKELEALADNLKQAYYQNYKSAYNNECTHDSEL